MRASIALAVSALLALAHLSAAAETLFQNDELATVPQQRGRSLLQTVPVYGCPNSAYPSERQVRVFVTITGTITRPAFFGLGQKALFDAIRAVYAKTGRASIAQRQIGGPAGQVAAIRNKTFLYTFTLPLGLCGADKRSLDASLRKAVATLKGGRVRGTKINVWK